LELKDRLSLVLATGPVISGDIDPHDFVAASDRL